MNGQSTRASFKLHGRTRRFDDHALEELHGNSIFEFFSRTRYVSNLLARFRKIGIRTVGDLISYKERELYKIVQATPSSQKRIRATLNECGLDFQGNKPPPLWPALKNIDRALKSHHLSPA